VDDIRTLAAAPETILSGEYYKTEIGDTFRYVPELSDVPLIAAPSMLPGLRGVADIHFSSALQSIAPSRAAGSNAVENVPDLPGLDTAEPATLEPAAAAALPSVPSSAPASVAASSAAAPPPPPPPPPAAPPPAAAAAPGAPPPPPPPPPPPALAAAPPPPGMPPIAPPAPTYVSRLNL
jgi:hypothetical protein